MHTRTALNFAILLLELALVSTCLRADAGDVPFEPMVRDADWIGIVRFGSSRENRRSIPEDVHDAYRWQREAKVEVLDVFKGETFKHLIIEFDNPYGCPDAEFAEGSKYMVLLTRVAFARYQSYHFYVSILWFNEDEKIVYHSILFDEFAGVQFYTVPEMKKRIVGILETKSKE